jgi:hypothetical protein
MATKSDFMAAEEIKAILQGRDKAEQERIIRWVAESVGISLATVTAVGSVLQSGALPQASQPTSPGGAVRRKDIKSFVSEKSPKNDVQFAAVVAYFYRFEASEADRKDVIVPQDLQQAGRQARGFGFNSPLTTLNNAVALGYFDRAGRGEFQLNAVGENLVAMTLPSGDASSNRRRRGKKKGSKKTPRQAGKKKVKAS